MSTTEDKTTAVAAAITLVNESTDKAVKEHIEKSEERPKEEDPQEEVKTEETKKKKKSSRRKKKPLPNLNLGATDFVPNATVSFDPVSEPKPTPKEAEPASVPAVAAPEKKKRRRGGGGGNKEESKAEESVVAQATAPAVKSDKPEDGDAPAAEGEANPEAADKPKKKKSSRKKKSGAAAQDPNKFNLDAPVFAPSTPDGPPSEKATIQLPAKQ